MLQPTSTNSNQLQRDATISVVFEHLVVKEQFALYLASHDIMTEI